MDYFTDTAIGELRLGPNGLNHIFVEGDLTVRGKTANCHLHFFLWNDGQWHLGTEKQPDYERRRQLYVSSSANASEKFRDKVIGTITLAVNEWAKENPEAIKAAKEAHFAGAIDRRTQQIGNHEQAIHALRAEIIRLGQGEELPAISDIKGYPY